MLKMEPTSIDDLPSDLIAEKILNRVPTRDAVRTSVLSPGWRHHWRSIPDLSFDDIPVAAIDSVLLQRSSDPIRSFSLTNLHSKTTVSDTDRWLLSLSCRRPDFLISLTLCFPFRPRPPLHRVSSHIFSFRSIQSLILTNCSFPPNSSNFSFPLLRILDLSYIDFPDNQCLHRLISASPNLTHLSLSKVYPSFPNLVIANPNLRYFSFFAIRECKSLVFAAAQALDEVVFNVKSDVFRSFPAGAACNGKLSLCRDVVEGLAKGSIPHSVPNCFQNLLVLDTCMNFTSTEQIMVLLCLIRSAPNLQKLQIRVKSSRVYTEVANDFWNATCQPDCLRTVELTLHSFLEADVNFMYFILDRASRLEKLIISNFSGSSSAETSFTIQMLKLYQSASPQAEIIYR